MTETTFPSFPLDPSGSSLARFVDVLRQSCPEANERAIAAVALALNRRLAPLLPAPRARAASLPELLGIRRSLVQVLEESGLGRRLGDAFGAVPSKSRKDCILIVDDAADVLVTLGAFLEGAGFEVLKAAGADAALRVLAVTPGVDAIVTDVAMPGMSGIDLVQQALELRPGLPAVIVTAFADPKLLASLPAQTRILRKPFRRADLVRCVEDLVRPEPGDRTGELGSNKKAFFLKRLL